MRHLDTIAEVTTVQRCGNWQVFDWPAVLQALLSERARSGDAESGTLVLQIGDADRLLLRVDAMKASAEATAEPAQITLDPQTAVRSLFGPLRPSWPRGAASWFPLPVHLPHTDRV